MQYDATTGSIKTKGFVGDAISYQGQGKPPHAVSSIAKVPSLMDETPQNITYTDFNKVKQISQGNKSYTLTYGVDRQRIKSVSKTANVTKQTKYYLGNYEEEYLANGKIRKLHYIYTTSATAGVSGSDLKAVYVQNDGKDTLYYTHTDYQGNLIKVTNDKGNVMEQYAYDPWGLRRNPAVWHEPDTRKSFLFDRGYTLHQHLDDFGLIDMNGRVYDPLLAQFLSPDPYIQSPGNWLNYNRYAYGFNNPLMFSDPDGEWIFTILASIFAPPLLPAALQVDMAWMQGGLTEMADGGNFWNGAGKGVVVGLANAGLSFLNIPGIIPNGLLHAGSNVLVNGISNSLYDQNFWKGAGWQAGFGFAGGAYSGYQLSKENGLNFWWGSEVKYGRTQWSFNTSEKPYETISWDINKVGSQKLNDCVPTSFAEANDYFGGTTTYDEYLLRTEYIEDVGVKTNRALYNRNLAKEFTGATMADPISVLKDHQQVLDIKKTGGIVHTNMPHSVIRHADNLRSIKFYHSGKVVMKFRIGSYRLSSVDNRWWFYTLNGVR